MYLLIEYDIYLLNISIHSILCVSLSILFVDLPLDKIFILLWILLNKLLLVQPNFFSALVLDVELLIKRSL